MYCTNVANAEAKRQHIMVWLSDFVKSQMLADTNVTHILCLWSHIKKKARALSCMVIHSLQQIMHSGMDRIIISEIQINDTVATV